MSKIEVDTIDKQSGSTLTLGGSGTAVTLASGATQTGFGRTGTVDWNTTPKTATFTAVSGDGFFANTSGGAFNMNLPAGSAGAIVSVADYAATWQTNNLTIVPNGSDKIGSVAQNATLNVEGQSVTFVFVDSTQGWINIMDSTSNVRGQPPFICASVSGTGNTLVTAPCCANAKVATFKGPGNFTVNSIGSAANNVVSYLVVAGGGNGGNGVDNTGAGSGGGAGGFREVKSPVTPYTASPLNGYANAPNRITVSAQAYPITVGAGGAQNPNSSQRGGNGSNSIFSTITSAGGGAGGSGNDSSPKTDSGPNPGPDRRGGVTGGSGGGSRSGSGPSYAPTPYGAPGIAVGNTPPVSPAQGFPGNMTTPPAGGGGGGGATVIGGAGSNDGKEKGGVGGAGAGTLINPATGEPGPGPSRYYSGGGGGSGYDPSITQAPGGLGGGGSGAYCVSASGGGSAGTTNTGGAGGGGIGVPGSGVQPGGTGGSGIVVIRYKFQ